MSIDLSQKQDDKNEKYSLLLWHRLASLYKNNLKGSSELLKKWELSNAQIDVMIQISMVGKLSQQELADKLLVTKGNVTQLLKKLEQMGLIQREKDWKTNYISLTDEGNRICEQIKPSLRNYQMDYFHKLSIEQKKQLLKLLAQIEK